jgi:hypothetical protein
MDNKILALIIIVILIVIGGVYFFVTQNNINSTLNTTNNSTINTTNNSTQTNFNITNSNNTTTQNTTANIKISAKKAQNIAVETTKDITGENDTAGTPSLFKWTANNKHTWVWKVPLTNTATGKTGSLNVDAITGNVILNE